MIGLTIAISVSIPAGILLPLNLSGYQNRDPVAIIYVERAYAL